MGNSWGDKEQENKISSNADKGFGGNNSFSEVAKILWEQRRNGKFRAGREARAFLGWFGYRRLDLCFHYPLSLSVCVHFGMTTVSYGRRFHAHLAGTLDQTFCERIE